MTRGGHILQHGGRNPAGDGIEDVRKVVFGQHAVSGVVASAVHERRQLRLGRGRDDSGASFFQSLYTVSKPGYDRVYGSQRSALL